MLRVGQNSKLAQADDAGSVKFDKAATNTMSEPRKESRKNNKEREDEENPTNIGPGITESHEEV